MSINKTRDTIKTVVTAFCMLMVVNIVIDIDDAKAESSKGIRIVSSIKPLALLIQEIINDDDQVEVLLEPNQDYQFTQLKPAQLQKITQADVIFYIDDSFEKFVKNAKTNDSAQYKYIQMSQTQNLRLLGLRKSGELPQLAQDNSRFSGNNQGNTDWHIWLNPDNAIVMLRKIRNELSKLRPDKQDSYQERYEIFSQHLIRYSHEKAEMMMKVLDSPFFVLQDGLQYFEEQFGLQSKGTIIQPGQKAPSSKHINELKNLRENYEVNIVVKEEKHPGKVITSLAGDKRFEVINVDYLAQGSFRHYEDYISYTDALTERIFSGLRK